MNNWKLAAAATALLAGVAGAQAANASVVFSDNFNSYDGQLNWAPPANWSVPSSSVDLIGETPSGTSFDFFPGATAAMSTWMARPIPLVRCRR